MLGRLGSSVARRHHVTHTMAAARTLSSLPIPYTASKEGPFKTGDSTAPLRPAPPDHTQAPAPGWCIPPSPARRSDLL